MEKELKENKQNKIVDYIYLFLICAFIGWVWEVFTIFIDKFTFVNRGTLHGPWLPIYGVGGLLIVLLLKKYKKKPLLIFIINMILCGVIEYVTAWYLETFKHLKWWDYSNMPFNLHGRIALENLIGFGIGGLIVLYLVYPILNKILSYVKNNIKVLICTIIFTIFGIDFIYSTFYPNTGSGITYEINTIQNN